MPTWGEVLAELQRGASETGTLQLDGVRRGALKSLSELTGRPTVIYASRWTQGDTGSPHHTSIGIGDVHGFMEVLHGLQGPSLDLLLHSGGGSAEATEAIVSYLRTRFDDVRVIVPLAAMSAATMLACSANKIVMGKHSYLGPIDPQLILQTPTGTRAWAAHAILGQFDMAMQQAADPKKFAAWVPMLQQYGPALLTTCQNVIRLSEELVSKWLAVYMFEGKQGSDTKARGIAENLNKHNSHMTHSRFIPREDVRALGIVVEDLEADQAFQDAVLTVFHATVLTFTMNGAIAKIIENHNGKAYMTAAPQPGQMILAPQLAPKPQGPPSGG